MTALPLLLLLVAAAGEPATATIAPPSAGQTWTVAAGSTLTYRLVHKFHSVEGVARTVEGRARQTPEGLVQVAVRARVDAFDSGNSNRDAHMKEVTEAARLPFVLLKAVAEGVHAGSAPGDVEIPLRGALEFHGVAREVAVTARLHFVSADRAEVEATFPVSLTAHGVERPSLLFVRVEDRIVVTARLTLVREQP